MYQAMTSAKDECYNDNDDHMTLTKMEIIISLRETVTSWISSIGSRSYYY